MEFTIGLAQVKRPDDGDVVGNVSRYARMARKADVDLLVFPEALMTRYDGSPERFAAQAQPADGPFAREIDGIAAREGLWMVYTINEANPSGGAPFNSAIVADSSGCQRAQYRKIHLFDAQGFHESDYLSAGNAPMTPVEAPFARIGLGICYDLRFPELARASALEGAQIMLYPAAWVDGPGKIMQWKTLLAARAIENGLFVAGAGSCDSGRIGHSCVFAPDGTLLAEGGDGEELITCRIDTAEIERVRAKTPSLEHLRPECYR